MLSQSDSLYCLKFPRLHSLTSCSQNDVSRNKSLPSSLTQIGLNAAQSRDPLVNTSFLIAGADRRAVNLCSRRLCRNLCGRVGSKRLHYRDVQKVFDQRPCSCFQRISVRAFIYLFFYSLCFKAIYFQSLPGRRKVQI